MSDMLLNFRQIKVVQAPNGISVGGFKPQDFPTISEVLAWLWFPLNHLSEAITVEPANPLEKEIIISESAEGPLIFTATGNFQSPQEIAGCALFGLLWYWNITFQNMMNQQGAQAQQQQQQMALARRLMARQNSHPR